MGDCGIKLSLNQTDYIDTTANSSISQPTNLALPKPATNRTVISGLFSAPFFLESLEAFQSLLALQEVNIEFHNVFKRSAGFFAYFLMFSKTCIACFLGYFCRQCYFFHQLRFARRCRLFSVLR